MIEILNITTLTISAPLINWIGMGIGVMGLTFVLGYLMYDQGRAARLANDNS